MPEEMTPEEIAEMLDRIAKDLTFWPAGYAERTDLRERIFQTAAWLRRLKRMPSGCLQSWDVPFESEVYALTDEEKEKQ
jgi:hypothetical protein